MKSILSAAFARGRLGAPRRFLRVQRHKVQRRNGHATALRAHPPTTHGLACGSHQLSLLPTALLCCSVARSADRQPRDGFCEHRDTRHSAGTAMRRLFERTRPPHTAWPVALANSHSCQRTALLCCSVSRSSRNHFQLFAKIEVRSPTWKWIRELAVHFCFRAQKDFFHVLRLLRRAGNGFGFTSRSEAEPFPRSVERWP